MISQGFVCDSRLFADKAYIDSGWAADIAEKYGLSIHTPRKKLKRVDDVLGPLDVASAYVSSVRQPIESFFHWLDEKTGIQVASKVRSLKGLLLHVFGRLAAALCSLVLAF